ncbi:MAG: phasin family protein [Azospirillaceae bacterium]|nr:phasin family protein [Azospirillaceae bacterium]
MASPYPVSRLKDLSDLARTNAEKAAVCSRQAAELFNAGYRTWINSVTATANDTTRFAQRLAAARSAAEIVEIQRAFLETSAARTTADLQTLYHQFSETLSALLNGLVASSAEASALAAHESAVETEAVASVADSATAVAAPIAVEAPAPLAEAAAAAVEAPAVTADIVTVEAPAAAVETAAAPTDALPVAVSAVTADAVTAAVDSGAETGKSESRPVRSGTRSRTRAAKAKTGSVESDATNGNGIHDAADSNA